MFPVRGSPASLLRRISPEISRRIRCTTPHFSPAHHLQFSISSYFVMCPLLPSVIVLPAVAGISRNQTPEFPLQINVILVRKCLCNPSFGSVLIHNRRRCDHIQAKPYSSFGCHQCFGLRGAQKGAEEKMRTCEAVFGQCLCIRDSP